VHVPGDRQDGGFETSRYRVGGFPDLPVECPYSGESSTVSLSTDLWNYYKGRGFQMRALCLTLASREVRYDPETGQRIPQYRLPGEYPRIPGVPHLGQVNIGGRWLPESFPFYAPNCFKTVQVISGKDTADTRWRPTGCVVRFDPGTGRPVQSGQLVEVYTGSEAGSGRDESTASRSSTVSDAKLGALVRGGR
jgi:hypothetical protein